MLKENSSSWILQVKPQVHPLKAQGILDIDQEAAAGRQVAPRGEN